MRSFNLKHIVGAFLIGLIIGVLIPVIFFSGDGTSVSNVPVISHQQILDREKAITDNYSKKLVSIENKNKSLQQSLDSTHEQLRTLKDKTKKQAIKIKKMVEPTGVPASSLLKRNQPDSADTNCDSLKNEISIFIEDTELKEESYEKEIAILNGVIANKDSSITLLKMQQQEKDGLLTTAVQQMELLANENHHLRKKIKRRKLGATLKTIGLMIATGAATHAVSNF